MALFKRGHIGLDIGTSAVRAAEISGGEKKPVVSRFGQVLLPRGAVVDGEVQEPEIVSQAIATLWKRAGFSSKSVRIGAANRRVVVRQVELPAMNREDLEGAIRFQAQDYIPIPLGEAVMDFEVVDEFVNPEGQSLVRVLVVAAERGMVDPLLAALESAKLEAEVLELNAYPLVRALGGDAIASEAEAIVDVGGGVTNVVIHQAGRIRFTRMLPSLGGDDFTRAISEALELDWEEAEELKTRASGILAQRLGAEEPPAPPPPPSERFEPEPKEPEAEETEEHEISLPSDDLWSLGEDDFDETDTDTAEPEDETSEAFPGAGENREGEVRPSPPEDLSGNDDEEPPPEIAGGQDDPEDPAWSFTSGPSTEDDVERAADVLEGVLQRFVGELRGSVDFYTTQSDALPLERVIVTGGGSLLGGLLAQVGSALRVPAERGHVFQRVPVGKVKLGPEQIEVAEPFLAVAVGLGLGGLES